VNPRSADRVASSVIEGRVEGPRSADRAGSSDIDRRADLRRGDLRAADSRTAGHAKGSSGGRVVNPTSGRLVGSSTSGRLAVDSMIDGRAGSPRTVLRAVDLATALLVISPSAATVLARVVAPCDRDVISASDVRTGHGASTNREGSAEGSGHDESLRPNAARDPARTVHVGRACLAASGPAANVVRDPPRTVHVGRACLAASGPAASEETSSAYLENVHPAWSVDHVPSADLERSAGLGPIVDPVSIAALASNADPPRPAVHVAGAPGAEDLHGTAGVPERDRDRWVKSRDRAPRRADREDRDAPIGQADARDPREVRTRRLDVMVSPL
jgi:hypothetical protein